MWEVCFTQQNTKDEEEWVCEDGRSHRLSNQFIKDTPVISDMLYCHNTSSERCHSLRNFVINEDKMENYCNLDGFITR